MAARISFACLRTSRTEQMINFSKNRWSSFRKFSSSKSPDTSSALVTPLSQSLPGLPSPKFAVVNPQAQDAIVSTISNGMRVASEPRFGQFCTVGVAVDAGSRYEVAYPSGVSHFLERLAFGVTENYQGRDHILQELEEHAGICDAQATKDVIVYAISVETKAVDKAVNILSEVILKPQITNEELEMARQIIHFEHEGMDIRPEPEHMLIGDLIHTAAYRDNTLGLPKTCPLTNIPVMDQRLLHTFLKQHYTPPRLVLSGVGVDHDHLMQLAEEKFARKTPVWETAVTDAIPVDDSIAQYTGGYNVVEKDLSSLCYGANPLPLLGHIVIGLESCSHNDPDFIAFCVLNMLMGGGGSFSAGGPGKGMYTRLYLNVLNRYHWIFNATAYNNAYSDSGLFCIYASAAPNQLRELTQVIIRELVLTTAHIAPEELSRGKRQLQSLLLMNLESRPVVFEDIARQVLAYGRRKAPQQLYEEIGHITAEDIQRVATRMLQTKPSVSALGDLSHMPSLDEIRDTFRAVAKSGEKKSRFSIFR